jgi:biopolymer transport protein ExbD/DNA-directed RNA polymerase subunit RPC12/RpoP
MTIRFRCPRCNQTLKAADRFAGRTARCTACGTKVTVPAASESQPVSQEPVDEGPTLSLPAATKYRAEDLVDMTAMVDIVFFLLIFFMVTSMQGVCASIGMPNPDPQKVSSKGQRTVAEYENDAEYIVVRIDQDDTVWIDDQEAPDTQELLVKLREALNRPEAPHRMLVLGNGDARHATVVRVLDAGNEVGLEDVRLALEEEP